jgi:hypothetical protein
LGVELELFNERTFLLDFAALCNNSHKVVAAGHINYLLADKKYIKKKVFFYSLQIGFSAIPLILETLCRSADPDNCIG